FHLSFYFFFFFNAPAPTEIYTLSLHDALPISGRIRSRARSRFHSCCPTANHFLDAISSCWSLSVSFSQRWFYRDSLLRPWSVGSELKTITLLKKKRHWRDCKPMKQPWLMLRRWKRCIGPTLRRLNACVQTTSTVSSNCAV